MAVTLLFAGALLVALVGFARAAIDSARADGAADAAALAGVRGGPESARRAARANGATLVAFRWREGDAQVEVVVGEAHAVARARLVPDDRTGGAEG